MHRTSFMHMRRIRDTYLSDLSLRLGRRVSVLDVGARRVSEEQRTYRDLLVEYDYTGADVEFGENVDVVITPWDWDIDDKCFDVVISGQMLEHDARFWESLREMGRVARHLVCIIAPSTSKYHAPPDYWRFMQDAPSVWVSLLGEDFEILEASTDRKTEHCDTLLVARRQ